MIFIDDLILYYRSYSAISIIHWIFGIDNEAMTTNYHQDHISFTVENLPLRATGPAFCDTPIVKGRKHVLTNLYVVPHRPLPVIDQRRALRVPMGNTTYLQCKSVGAEPAPVLRWVDGEGNSLISTSHQGVGKYDVVSRLSLTMTPELVGTNYRCIADFSKYPDLQIQESPYSVYLFNKNEAGKKVTGFKCPTLPEASEESQESQESEKSEKSEKSEPSEQTPKN